MNLREIFEKCLEIDDSSKREAFLRDVCGSDDVLRDEVKGLLAEHERTSSFFLDRKLSQENDHQPITEKVGSQIGPYRLMEQIGEGGMGLVFVAEQTKPMRRKVALKIIKPGMDTKNVVARFEAERQALALMDHPNIARVLDGGETDSGRPFFVMELVKGIPITDYCDRRNLPPRERLKLFLDVCQAIQHAHQKGVIHRDLKPSNVLVTEHGGSAVTKIIDFGVAKATNQRLTDRTVYTAFQQVIGTPLYMSPEQADLSGLDVDTRSDVYSLGVLLYELLTGVTPFDKQRFCAAAFEEIRRIIREEEPPKPSTRVDTLGDSASSISGHRQTQPGKLKQLLFGELDWIVMKALDKDRSRRYESASSFALDVQAFLDDAPVTACPPSFAYRAKKLFRRYRIQSAVAAGFLALLMVSSVVAWFLYGKATTARDEALAAQADLQEQTDVAVNLRDSADKARSKAESAQQRAERENRRARDAEDLLKQKVYDYSLFRASEAFNRGDYFTANASLEQSPDSLRGWEWQYLTNALSHSRRRTQHFDDTLALTVSHDGQLVANLDSRGELAVHELKSGQRVWAKSLDKLPIQITIGKSAERIYLSYMPVFTDPQKRQSVQNALGRIRAFYEIKTIVLDAHTGADLYELPQTIYWQESIDGSTLATVAMPNLLRLQTGPRLNFVDAQTGEIQNSATFGGGGGLLPLNRNFSPDGSRCFTLQNSPRQVTRNVVQCWDVATAKELWRKDIDGGLGLKWVGADQLVLHSMPQSKDEDASILPKTKFQFLSTENGDFVSELESPVAGESELSPNGELVATRDHLGNVVVWERASRQIVENLQVSASNTGWTSDGLALRMLDELQGEVSVYPLSGYVTKLNIPTVAGQIRSLAFSADGSQLFACASDDSVRAWDANTGELLARFPVRMPMDVGCFTGSNGAFVGGHDGLYEVAMHPSPQIERISGSPEVLAADFYLVNEKASAAIVNQSHVSQFRLTEELHCEKELPINFYGFPNVARSRATDHLVASSLAELHWGTGDKVQRKQLQLLPGLSARREALEFHPKEPIFAWRRQRIVKLCRINAGGKLEAHGDLRGHQGAVTAIAFSPDGSRLFTTDQTGNLFVWNSSTQEQLLRLSLSDKPLTAIAVSNDGTQVAAASDREVVVLSPTPRDGSVLRVRSDTTRAMELVRDLFSKKRYRKDVERALAEIPFDRPEVERIAQRIAAANGDRAMESAIKLVSQRKKQIHLLVKNGNMDEAAELLAQLAALSDIVDGEEEEYVSRRLAYLSSYWGADNPPGGWKIPSTSVNELYQQAIGLDPENYFLAFAHAERTAKRGLYREALDEFNRALSLTKPFSQSWYRTAYRIAVLHLYFGDDEKYRSICRQALDQLPAADIEVGARTRAAFWCCFSSLTSAEDLELVESLIRDLEPADYAPISDATPPDKTRLTGHTRVSEWLHLARGAVCFRRATFDEAIRWLDPISTFDFQSTNIRYLAHECRSLAREKAGMPNKASLLQMTSAKRVAQLRNGNRPDGRPVIGDWHISMMLKVLLDEHTEWSADSSDE